MLIDWEQAGFGREFEIRVPDVNEAMSFYHCVLGAQETSRQPIAEGNAVRLGLSVGGVHFAISSDTGDSSERPLLPLLAADLGVPYIAILLHVEELQDIASRAEQNGAAVSVHESGEIAVLTDPYGSHWVLQSELATSSVPFGGNTLH